jgi:bacillolysin
VPGTGFSKAPQLAPERAAEVALGEVAARTGAAGLRVVSAELAVYRSGLTAGRAGRSVLAYGVVVEGAGVKEQVWVDARTGAVLERIPLRHEALHRIVYSPSYNADFPDLFVLRREGDAPTNVPQADKLYDFSGQIYELYKNGFGRDSYDGAGAIMRTVYLVNQECPNAYWDGATTNYCPSSTRTTWSRTSGRTPTRSSRTG